MPAGVQTERPRRTCQAHARFIRRAAPLSVVARVAAGHQILPRGLAGPRPRNHVVERQLIRAESPVAILARITVAHQNVLARKRARLHGNATVFEQTNNARHRHGLPCGMHVRAGVLLGRGHSLEDQHQRPPRRAHIDRLVTRI